MMDKEREKKSLFLQSRGCERLDLSLGQGQATALTCQNKSQCRGLKLQDFLVLFPDGISENSRCHRGWRIRDGGVAPGPRTLNTEEALPAMPTLYSVLNFFTWTQFSR
jgi:hypothetical protein